MVSLARVRHSNVYCEEADVSTNVEMPSTSDSQLLLQPVIGERPKPYGSINTFWAAFLLLFISVSLGVFLVILSIIWPVSDIRECESYFWVLYLHTSFWSVTFILDVYFRRKHTESRIEGYLEFYNEIISYSRGPFYVSTLCNAGLLAMSVVFHQHYGDMTSHCQGNILDPLHYVSAFVFLEVIVICVIIITYLVKLRKFNSEKTRPDALRDEWMACFIRDSYSGGEVGYRERDDHIRDLLEKQADLLRYLKEQNSRLVQKVTILSLQLQEKHSPSIT